MCGIAGAWDLAGRLPGGDITVLAALVDRPKMGFGVRIDLWLRGALRNWAGALIDPVRLTNDGFLNARAVREKWEQHMAGTVDWHYWLWDVLMFQAWREGLR